MPKKPATLYAQCLMNIVRLLKNSYWSSDYQGFKKLSAEMIDTLIDLVLENSTSEPLERSHLQLLFTSGQVTTLDWDCDGRSINASAVTIKNILKDILPASHELVTVVLCLNLPRETRFDIITPVLNDLLSRARNIGFVESDIPFDPRVLCHCEQLTELHLKFHPSSPVQDLLKVDGHLRTNTALSQLRMFDKHGIYETVNLDTAIILKYCTHLNWTNFDIARGLEELHAAELNNGTLTHAYNIQVCSLGNRVIGASETAVRIAAIVCPYIERLLVVVKNTGAMSALSNFRSIHYLAIFWNSTLRANYTMTIRRVLELQNFGNNLNYLNLYNFEDVDITSIGVFCPNLSSLSLHNSRLRCNSGRVCPTLFPKLDKFFLHNSTNASIKKEQLAEVLYGAVNLRSLTVICLLDLTDDVLEEICRQNCLSKLETLKIFECRLSLVGIAMLASTVRSLEMFHLVLWEGDKDDIRRIFRENNPKVEVKFEDL